MKLPAGQKKPKEKVHLLETDDKLLAVKLILFIGLLVAGAVFFSATAKAPQRAKSNTKVLSDAEIAKRTQTFVSSTTEGTKEAAGDVLGEITQYISQTASRSAASARAFVVENTVGSLIKQIDKLSEEEKEEIRQQVCK